MIILATIVFVVSVISIAISFLAYNSFDNIDPDQFFYDEYAVIQCPHKGSKTDVVINSCVTCETIHTVCDDCGEILNVKIDCI